MTTECPQKYGRLLPNSEIFAREGNIVNLRSTVAGDPGCDVTDPLQLGNAPGLANLMGPLTDAVAQAKRPNHDFIQAKPTNDLAWVGHYPSGRMPSPAPAIAPPSTIKIGWTLVFSARINATIATTA